MNLRPYQININNLIAKKLARTKRVIFCLPTGAGKTFCFSNIVQRHLAKDAFNRVLILTNRSKLFDQTFEAIHRLDIKPFSYTAKAKLKEPIYSRCIIGMVETVKRRNAKSIPPPTLIIIDEAHIGSFKKIFEIFPDSLYIGATATPLATKKKDPLNNYYNDIAFQLDTPDLIELGYLNPAETWAVRSIDESQLKKRQGEYTDASQLQQLEQAKPKADFIQAYKKHAQGKKTLVFCVNVDHTIKTHERLKELNPNAFLVHSKQHPNQNELNILEFHESSDGVLVNCGILTTGYDHPAIECIMVHRSTTSLTLWLQMCGRGSRLSPETNKSKFTIVDLGNNAIKHLLWEARRDWEKLFKHPPQPSDRSDGVQGVKECPKCHMLLAPSILVCPECAHKFQIKAKDNTINGETFLLSETLKNVKDKPIAELSVPELIELQAHKNYKTGFIVRILRQRPPEDLKLFAKLKGYKSGWVQHQLQGAKDYTNFKVKL